MHAPTVILRINQLLYLLLIASIVFSFRAVTSISIGVILLVGLLANRRTIFTTVRQDSSFFFITGCLLYFLLQVISVLYTHDLQEGWDHVRLKSGLLLVPLAMYCSRFINAVSVKFLSWALCSFLAIASVYCMLLAIPRYRETNDTGEFFYHRLVSPLEQHAVYFSIYIFAALVFLLEHRNKKVQPSLSVVKIAGILFFTGILLLLSSKLVLVFFGVYLACYLLRYLKKNNQQKSIGIGLALLLAGALVLVAVTKNPVRERFLEITSGKMALVQQQHYNPADAFNGVQFRLIQWKFVTRILDQHKAWWWGVSAGDAQAHLDQQYRSVNMYIGEPARNDRGFLGYNTHNQLLESLLQHGIAGLLVFLFLAVMLLRMARTVQKTGPVFIMLLVGVYAFAESLLETQYGIIIFTFFPLALYWGRPAGTKPFLKPSKPFDPRTRLDS